MRRHQSALCPKAFPKTAELLTKLGLGYEVTLVDLSKLAKAEAGLSCCSVIIE